MLALYGMKYLSSNTGELLKKILLLLVLYSFCRILFYLFNMSYFSEIGLGGLLSVLFYGIYFDASAIMELNFTFIGLFLLPIPFREHRIYKRILFFLFVTVNGIGLLSNCTDLVYFQFTTKRTTADVFNFFGGGIGNDFGRLLPLFLKDYWYVFIIWAGLLYVMIKGYKKAENNVRLDWNPKQYLRQTGLLVFNFCLAVLIYRGGLQLRPIGIVNAGVFVDTKTVPLLLNTPFSIMKSMEVVGIEPTIYFKDENELKKHFSPYHAAKPSAEMRKMNVCIIALESFSKEYISTLNRRKEGYTPFLDSLIGQSLVFPNAFANGKKSIEGIPAIIASIPTWTNEPYLTSRYGGNEINTLASLLKTEGYSTAFYHGGTNGTMGFDAFAKLSGYDNYYGRKEYNNEKDYDGNWGIWDEEFLQYTAQSLNQRSQPFFATIFTLTSHHPFPVPDKYKGKFKDGPNKIEKSIGYSDYSLKQFFDKASRMPWFKNTLFVLVADHTGLSQDPFYTNRIGNFSIPIIYYMQGSNLKGMDSTITQQIDIMPSVLEKLNYTKPYFAFGNSVFDSNAVHFAMNFNNERYQYIQDFYTTEFSSTSNGDLFYYKTDSFLFHDLSAKEKKLVDQMDIKAKAIIQTYEQSIINNKMH